VVLTDAGGADQAGASRVGGVFVPSENDEVVFEEVRSTRST